MLVMTGGRDTLTRYYHSVQCTVYSVHTHQGLPLLPGGTPAGAAQPADWEASPRLWAVPGGAGQPGRYTVRSDVTHWRVADPPGNGGIQWQPGHLIHGDTEGQLPRLALHRRAPLAQVLPQGGQHQQQSPGHRGLSERRVLRRHSGVWSQPRSLDTFRQDDGRPQDPRCVHSELGRRQRVLSRLTTLLSRLTTFTVKTDNFYLEHLENWTLPAGLALAAWLASQSDCLALAAPPPTGESPHHLRETLRPPGHRGQVRSPEVLCRTRGAPSEMRLVTGDSRLPSLTPRSWLPAPLSVSSCPGLYSPPPQTRRPPSPRTWRTSP